MLNISPYSIKDKINLSNYKSFREFDERSPGKRLARLLTIVFIMFVIIAFLPWTQNIRGNGKVTALYPQQRPQDINSLIDGRIEKWYVREGQHVQKGDTILYISEIKDSYFDPRLIERTQKQLEAKEQSLTFYAEKAEALNDQIAAIEQNRQLKLEQARNYLKQTKLKIQADSIEYEAAQVNLQIAERQLTRQEELYEQGLKSLTDLETKKLKVQETLAKKINAESKLLSSRNQLLNAKIELNTVYNDYTDKLQKARSDQFTAQSSYRDMQTQILKMENQLTNYQVRAGFYYVTAPQNGYITEAISTGIGENIKAGDPLVTIMPDDISYAVEMFVAPQDLPLIHVGNHVRLVFDGWPSIVFSGWPTITYGTFGGQVVAIDRFISNNGKYRILIAPEDDEPEWPDAIRVGSGANGLALLNDVPIWYEIWRQINGFPPNYYTGNNLNGDTDVKLNGKAKK